MANHFSHACLPYPIRGAKYSIAFDFPNPDGVDPTGNFDTEVSKDGGAFADATEEVTVLSGSNTSGSGWITFTASEMTCVLFVALLNSQIAGQPASQIRLKPRKLPVMAQGTASAGGASTIDLAASAAGYEGCIVLTTGGTGVGQAREIVSVSGNQVTVSDAWETNPDATTTYQILRTELTASTGGGGSAPTVVEIRQEMDSNSTRLAAIEADTQDIQSRLPAALVSGRMDSSVGAMANDVVTAASLAADAGAEIRTGLSTLTQADIRTAVGLSSANLDTQLADIPTVAEFNARTIVSANYALEATLTAIKGATFNGTTDSLEAIRDRGDAAWVTATGFSTLTQADVRTAVGLASANLDSQLNALGTLLLDIPTVAEFNARTLASAAYATAAVQTSQGGTLSGIVNETDKIPTIITNQETWDEPVWRRFYKKVTMDATSIKTYADNGIDIVTTQVISDVGGLQTQGAAT